MLEDIALSSFRHGLFRMDELKCTNRELLMAAYRDTGEAKIPGWASCLTTGSWGSVFLFVDRFPWSGRQRRTRTGCATRVRTLTRLQKNSATTSAYGDGHMWMYSPSTRAYARRQWVDAWTAMTFPGRRLSVL